MRTRPPRRPTLALRCPLNAHLSASHRPGNAESQKRSPDGELASRPELRSRLMRARTCELREYHHRARKRDHTCGDQRPAARSTCWCRTGTRRCFCIRLVRRLNRVVDRRRSLVPEVCRARRSRRRIGRSTRRRFLGGLHLLPKGHELIARAKPVTRERDHVRLVACPFPAFLPVPIVSCHRFADLFPLERRSRPLEAI